MASERSAQPQRYPPIGAYGLIGDCQTAALVSREGSVDWYCPARFDGPAVFCRLLDAEKGGYLHLAPTETSTTTRRYRGPTGILETTVETASGRVRVTDLMPVEQRRPAGRGQDVVSSNDLPRLVEALNGEPELELAFRPTFDYARARPELSLVDGVGVVAHARWQYLALACPA